MSKNDILSKDDEETISYDGLKHGITRWLSREDLKISVVTGELVLKDHLGTLAVRLGFWRQSYKVPSGLYGMGEPDENAPLFVTANYKYSFDLLRDALKEKDAWILVLDTKGINVWCAAGKGTFSSRELIYQLHKWKLKKILKHRQVVLPQLGAAQMEPHLVRRYSGFKIVYGPIRASDLKVFMECGQVADEAMRTVEFPLKERLYLAPVEVHNSLKYGVLILVFMYLMTRFGTHGLTRTFGMWEALPVGLAFLSGTVVFPICLPVLPFKRFALKGLVLGGVLVAGYIILLSLNNGVLPPLTMASISLGMLTIVAALGLVFTGSTTFTSFSGTDLETRQTLPYLGVGCLVALVLYMFSKLG